VGFGDSLLFAAKTRACIHIPFDTDLLEEKEGFEK
jgi:hypothetical protein